MTPNLGLDLVGGTSMRLRATTDTGAPPAAESMERARDVIQRRVDGFGVAEAEVVVEGNQNIIINMPGENSDIISQVGKPAQLRFRKVVNSTQATTVPPLGTATPAQRSASQRAGHPQPDAHVRTR